MDLYAYTGINDTVCSKDRLGGCALWRYAFRKIGSSTYAFDDDIVDNSTGARNYRYACRAYRRYYSAKIFRIDGKCRENFAG